MERLTRISLSWSLSLPWWRTSLVDNTSAYGPHHGAMALHQRFKCGFILAINKPNQEFSVGQLRSGYTSQPADVLQESKKVSGRHIVDVPPVLPGLYVT